ncbi:hypothetical protein WME90_42480 [Sorangium sp. So ce375]|uniref:hypothetical protein n=1 Tax=Sorangium sp. So ce375 TaxID=3133306 RepID=UPI003F5B8165
MTDSARHDERSEEYLILEMDLTSRSGFGDAVREMGLELQRTVEKDPKTGSYEEIWATPDKRAAINYVEDAISRQTFLWVRAARVKELVHEIKKRLPVYEFEDLADEAWSDLLIHDQRVNVVNRLAVICPKFNEEVLRIFRDYLSMPDPLLRQATLFAIAYRSWPEVLPLVEEVAAKDPDEQARSMAARIAASLKQRPS